MEQTGRFKKLLSLLLTVFMIVSAMTVVPLTAFAADDLVPPAIDGVEGAGTEADPYLVSDLESFGALTLAANGGQIAEDTVVYVEFTDDIEIAETDDFYAGDFSFKPSDAYGGMKIAWRIDGKGHTISNMVVPLFGSIGATTEGVVIKNLTLSGDMTSTIRYAGMVVGAVYGDLTVENVTTYGSLTTTKARNNILLGGIVGVNVGYNVTIRNCTNNADITQSTGAKVAAAGGILGETEISGAGNRTSLTLIENCTNNGTITSDAAAATVAVAAGGILGVAQPAATQANIDWDVVITGCENNGAVDSSTDGAYCGAIVGLASRYHEYPSIHETSSAVVTITNCLNTVANLDLYTNSAELPLELVVSNNQTNVHTHTYDNNCDADCNTCDNVRTAPHSYDNACDVTCNGCGATRTVSHIYDNACDTTCNGCGETRTISHTYDNIYDTSCNVCGASRPGSVGTKDNPYLVSDLDSLMVLMQAAEENDIPADTVFYVEFTADIEIRDTADFRATSVTFNNSVYGNTNSAKIAWRIDGKGHTISNMVLPLFHSIGQTTEGVEIKNLNLSGDVISSQRFVGMLIGAAYGDLTVENVTTNGSVTTTKTSNTIHVGGIVGHVISNNVGCDVTIRNCTNHANVTQNTAINSNSPATAGGIVGGISPYISGNTTSVVIENSTNNGAIVSDGAASILAAGGIVALVIPDLRSDNIVFDLKITNCVNNGTASSLTSGAYCGALVGYMTREPNYSSIGLNSSALVTLSNCTSTVFGLTLYTNSAELPLELVVSNNQPNGHTHTYSNACDTTCNTCGAVRTAPHAWAADCDAECDCGATREPLADHNWADDADTECDDCGKTRILPSVIEGVEGAGTQASPYIIDSLDAFGALTLAANNGEIAADTVVYVEFTSDIEIAETDDFFAADFAFNPYDAYGGKPAGKVAWRIDGKGHTISNMVTPLFGSVGATTDGIEIKNLTLSGDMTSTIRYAGMVVGAAYGELTVENVTTNGSLKTTKAGGNILVGGIVGTNFGYNVYIRNCTNNADITQNTGNRACAAGGILGAVEIYGAGNRTSLTTIENCTNNGTIVSDEKTNDTAYTGVFAGGIVGLAMSDITKANIDWDVVVTNCENNGAVVSSTDGAYCGALVGYMTREPAYPNIGEGSSATVTVSNCTSTVSGLVLYTNSETLPLTLVVSNNSQHAHRYDNDCDADCNTCGAERTPTHVYDNGCDAICNVCRAPREAEHVYDNDCDTKCNRCNAKREAPHVYDNDCDSRCNNCNAKRNASHHYDNACDPICNVCDEARNTDHVYDNDCDKECNACEAARDVEHIYDDACDTKCNVCKEKREAPHVYDNACDERCNECNAKRKTAGHVYDGACDATCNECGDDREASAHVYSDEKDMNCDVCGAMREVKTEHEYTTPADTQKSEPPTTGPTVSVVLPTMPGCGGSLSSIYSVLAIVLLLGFAFVAKKREEN